MPPVKNQVGAAVGKHPFGQLIVVIVMILLGTAQYVGYLIVTFVIGKTPFLAQRSPVADNFAGRGVMVGKNGASARQVWWRCGSLPLYGPEGRFRRHKFYSSYWL